MRRDNYIFVVTHYCMCAVVIDNVICRIHRNGGTSEWVTGRETEGNGLGAKVRRESVLDLIKSNCEANHSLILFPSLYLLEKVSFSGTLAQLAGQNGLTAGKCVSV